MGSKIIFIFKIELLTKMFCSRIEHFIFLYMKAKRIAKGHYEYRGFKIICIGYYHPERRVVWECVDENGNGFGHDYSLKACKFWIDEELKGNHL